MSSDNNSSPRRRGLKINNEASTLPPPKVNPTSAFNEKADQAFNRDQEYKAKAAELGTKYRSFLEDKILPENKTLINKDIEQETVNKLILLANEMNNDEIQPEGIGGVVLSILLMKMLLVQRDTINSLAYKIDKLEKSMNVLVSEAKTAKSSQ